MSRSSIATAYVQILPSADGIKEHLADILGVEADKAGEKAGQGLGSKLIGSLTKFAAAAGVGKIISDTIAAGADFEQLTGGVEKLFGNASTEVMKFARDAYKTAGLSANEYMEQVTGFSASLISSMGGDTAAAAKVADMALRDMSDNANTFGTDMEALQNAYNGFSKQNYTMLDNLKLGYGGTKTEMERLLKDAQAFSGVEYNIDNLNDVYEAIHVIQEQTNIAGTTAKEAATTFSGSFQMMKASAENLLTAMGSGEGVKEALGALLQSSYTFVVDNGIPMLWTIAKGVPVVLGEALTTYGPELVQKGAELLPKLGEGIETKLPTMIESAGKIMNTMVSGIGQKLPSIMESGFNLLGTFSKGIIKNLPSIAGSVAKVISGLLAAVGSNFPQIAAKGFELLGKLLGGIINAIPQIPGYVSKVIGQIKSGFSGYDWGSIGKNIIDGIAKGIRNFAGNIVSAAKSAAKSAFEGAKSLLGIHSPSTLFRDQIGKNIALGMAEGIEGNEVAVTAAVRTVSENAATMRALRPDTAAMSSGSEGEVVSLLMEILDRIPEGSYVNGKRLVESQIGTIDQMLGQRSRRAARGVI